MLTSTTKYNSSYQKRKKKISFLKDHTDLLFFAVLLVFVNLLLFLGFPMPWKVLTRLSNSVQSFLSTLIMAFVCGFIFLSGLYIASKEDLNLRTLRRVISMLYKRLRNGIFWFTIFIISKPLFPCCSGDPLPLWVKLLGSSFFILPLYIFFIYTKVLWELKRLVQRR